MKSLYSLLISFAIGTTLFSQNSSETQSAIDKLEKNIPFLMKKSKVAGFSIALIRDGKIVWNKGFGMMNATTQVKVSERTVFECNSLSKPVFAYAVMKLIDAGKMDLDTPVIKYLDTAMYFSKDPRFARVTTRLLLSNSSGIRQISKKEIGFNFDPGSQWQYQPAGWNVLSKIVEKISGKPIAIYMQEQILEPLGMKNSSYTWLPAYDTLLAYQHDWQGKTVGDRAHWDYGIACCSLESTPSDYAKFLIALMDGKGLSSKNRETMLDPQVTANQKYPSIAWGVGIGLETNAGNRSAWHWGHGTNCKDYFTADLDSRNAVVFFSNSDNGLFFIKEILTDALGRSYQGPDFLGYERYDSPTWLALNEITKDGSKTYLLSGRSKKLNENDINGLGYKLLEIHKLNDALALFKLNTTNYPTSYNAWDSYAEALVKAGNKKEAIKMYKKSLALNPQSESGKKALEELTK